MAKYNLSEKADQDLERLTEYIAQDNYIAAEKWLDGIYKKCKTIANSPFIGRKRPELGKNIRSFPVGKFVIFYQPFEDEVIIARILRGAMDITETFFESER